jgi:hypothetical protein
LRTNVKVTSVNQQVRQTKSTQKLGVTKSVNLGAVTDYLALYKTGYETRFTPEIVTAINDLSKKKKIKDFPYSSIAVIVDTSPSMKGHKTESKNTPRAIADFTYRVLRESCAYTIVEKTEGEATDLATSFIKAMKNEADVKPFDAIFFITDGYENAYEGLTNEVVTAFMSESGRYIPTFQISPIVGAEMEANVRPLGDEIVKLAISSPSALMPQINGRLLEVDTKRWLENQVSILEKSSVTRYKKNKNVEV